jgi:glycosyltransferase involved in cell wall biosynthesis
MQALLTVAVSTIDLRILELQAGALPQDDRWQYLFIVQRVAQPQLREKVQAHVARVARGAQVVFSHSVGLAASRNEAIEQAGTDYIHFCDDDLLLMPKTLGVVIDTLVGKPALDGVWCRSATSGGALRKDYPAHGTTMSVLNSGGVGTPELVFRMAAIRRFRLRFDERFGAGSQYPQGEEYIFVADLLRAGGRGIHLDSVLFEHEAESSGARAKGREGRATRAAVLERVFGAAVLPYKLAYIARHLSLYRSLADVASFLAPQLSRER